MDNYEKAVKLYVEAMDNLGKAYDLFTKSESELPEEFSYVFGEIESNPNFYKMKNEAKYLLDDFDEIMFTSTVFNVTDPELILFIKNNFLNLLEVKLDQYPNSLFYVKEDKCIFDLDLNRKVLYTDPIIWSDITGHFNYSYQELSNLIKSVVEPNYKLYDITPIKGTNFSELNKLFL